VFRSLPQFDFRASFGTWFYRVATNLCLDVLRRQSREQRRNLPLEAGEVKGEMLRSDRAGPEKVVLQKEMAENLKRAVGSLPEGYRVALVLHHYQGLSYRQVAEVTGFRNNR
jgi:RNA polymerase sigma-70 factor (ECF subfamily)